ncbi:MAG: aldolase/citrate lyase family protein [Pseudomonadota bacterium]
MSVETTGWTPNGFAAATFARTFTRAAATGDDAERGDVEMKRPPVIGAWVDMAALAPAEILAAAGFDFLLIDLEHGPAAMETAHAQILAAERWGATAVVRVAKGDDPWIKHALDLGAGAIMCPAVETAEQAEAAARAFRFGPVGRRGAGTRLVRASNFGADPDYELRWNETGFLILQIESPEALANAAEIAAVQGVGCLFFGPSDYAAAAGYPGGAAVKAAYRRLRDIAHRAGLYVGAVPFADVTAHDLAHDPDLKADIIPAGSDIGLLRRSAEAALAAARGDLTKA